MDSSYHGRRQLSRRYCLLPGIDVSLGMFLCLSQIGSVGGRGGCNHEGHKVALWEHSSLGTLDLCVI